MYSVDEDGAAADITSAVLNFSSVESLAITCMESYNGNVYFGTSNGLYYFTYGPVILLNKVDKAGSTSLASLSIVDMCTASSGIAIATATKYYVLSNLAYTEEETRSIKSFSLAEVNGHKVTDNVLKTVALGGKHYAVSTEGLVDLSDYSKTLVNGTVTDAVLTQFRDVEAVVVTATSGIFAFTLDDD